jgi:hypothetical protein
MAEAFRALCCGWSRMPELDGPARGTPNPFWHMTRDRAIALINVTTVARDMD